MEDQLVSFETAKLAKEKGFEFEIKDDDDYERGFHSFMGKRNDPNIISPLSHWYLDTNQNSQQWIATGVDAPTQSLLQRWLREVHNIHVQPLKHFHNKGFKIGKIIRGEQSYNGPYNKKFNSYEEALEAGLLEALKVI